MIVSLIVAASDNNVIGKNNALPWHLPDDLQYFRMVTKGHPVIMGRKTYESIGKPLPNRRNIVLSKTLKEIPAGVEVEESLGPALMKLATQVDDNEEVFVIGGAHVLLEAFITYVANKLYLTRVHAEVEGDVFLPEIDWSQRKKVSEKHHLADDRHQYAFTFEVYEKRA